MLQFFYIFSEFCGMHVDIAQSCYFDLTFLTPCIQSSELLFSPFHMFLLCLVRLGLGNTTREILHNSFFVLCLCNICE